MALLFDFALPRLQQLGAECGQARPGVVELQQQAGARVNPDDRARAGSTPRLLQGAFGCVLCREI